ncbi:MAG: CPBP family intramembrane glutamic endopeptidase [Vicinamibacterales bacterium]
MDAHPPDSGDATPATRVSGPAPTPAERATALLEVLLCSDYPTQVALAATFAAFGLRPQSDGSLSIGYIAAISLLDSVFLIGLIIFFLRIRGESPREVLFGNRPVGVEARAGIPLIVAAFAIAIVLMLALQAIAPWLHTVPHNPLQDLVRTPKDAALFVVVLIVAGGIREEVQRAFLLRRFERWLGGPRVGLVVTSAAFGAGHFVQGADAVVATAALGAFWGSVYLRRRSIGAPVVSHAGFNVLQVVQYLAFGR